MADYEPLDISALCNAPLDTLEAEEEPVAGTQTFRGLPFMVGGLVDLAEGAPSVTIPIGGPVRRIIFAHTQLETTVAEDGHWGRHVADYVFRTADGVSERVPIRERFEIGVLPGRGTVPGGLTSQFRAVSDSQPELQPRYEGEFGRAGWRPHGEHGRDCPMVLPVGLAQPQPGHGRRVGRARAPRAPVRRCRDHPRPRRRAALRKGGPGARPHRAEGP